MKTTNLNRLTIGIVIVAALLGAVTKTHAQTVTASITNNFDVANSASGWTYWYDIYAPPYNSVILDWSSTVNNGGAVGSGSLVYSNGWPGTNVGVGGHGQNQIWGTFAHTGGSQYDFSQTVDGSKYDSISFDIRANPGAPLNAQSNLAQLTVGFFTSNYQVHGTTNVNIPPSATNSWYHVVALVNKSDPALSTPAAGWAFNVNCYNNINGSLFTNTTPTIFYIDNIQANRGKDPLRPPTVSSIISEPVGGLNLFSSSGSSDQFQRTNIKLISTIGTGWLGQTNVTYSFTIKNFPSVTNYSGYQAHIFLTTGAGTSSGLDYADPNVIFLDVKQNANGTASGVFRYKTNQPQGNAMIYGAGTLGTVGSSNILGTWSLTFNQDTNITVTSPDGRTFATNITADAAALFAEPLNVVFGAQPNNAANIGQAVVLANASITNAGAGLSIVYDNFLDDTDLDLSTWSRLSTAPNTVLIFPPDPGQKLITWSLPDAGFGLQVTTNLANSNAWTILTGNEYFGQPLLQFPTSTSRATLVPSTYLGPTQNFFRLFTRRFTKLQVLMPGEVAAPGTPTGKTGTPDPQQVNAPFIVTVNAVDANWKLAVTGGDAIHLTSSSGTATLPADGPLVGGTRNFNVTINAGGTFTITATDVDDPTKTPNTGSSTTANP